MTVVRAAQLCALLLMTGCLGSFGTPDLAMTPVFRSSDPSGSVIWTEQAAGVAYEVGWDWPFDESTGFYIAAVNATGIHPLLAQTAVDLAHFGRGPALVYGGAGPASAPPVDSPLPSRTARGGGVMREVFADQSVLVACWGQSIGNVELLAVGGERTDVEVLDARSWTQRDFEGGARVGTPRARISVGDRITTDAGAVLVQVTLFTGDGSRGNVTIRSPSSAYDLPLQEHSPVEVRLDRREAWLLSQGPVEVLLDSTSEGGTKIYVTACEVPFTPAADVWRLDRDGVGDPSRLPRDAHHTELSG